MISAKAPGCFLTALVALCLLSCGGAAPDPPDAPKMIILGIDGMDPNFIEDHWDVLPNLKRLAAQGGFQRLATTIPPQSPVAWSTMITGMDPGGHGIFDFVHRDPYTLAPFSSMAKTSPAGTKIEMGDFVLPLDSAEVTILRAGEAFWKLLAEAGVPATVLKMPANFPPVECEARSLSGMGTPDVQGTFGTFTLFTDDPEEETRTVPGGKIIRMRGFRHTTELDVPGPPNSFRKGEPQAMMRLTVYRDPEHPVVRIDDPEGSVVLKEGEWSGWRRASFPLLGGVVNAGGIYRLFLKQVRPRFQLYVSPVNIDPAAPALPISTPQEYASALERVLGPYYTQGMPEDTSALRAGALSLDEFLAQSHTVLEESIAMFRHAFREWRSGLLFVYFSSIDQNAHMLWGRHDDKLLEFYIAMDGVVGEALDAMDGDTVFLVMSDHGFQRFDRGVNLNTLLVKEGFMALKDPEGFSDEPSFPNVDWSRTRAYAMGLNGLYLNLQGREPNGIVSEGEEAEQLIAELRRKLTAAVDPETGETMIEELYRSEEIYEGYNLEFAPDLQVGYRPPYRASWDTPLGAAPEDVVVENTDLWIGDHCIAPEYVPGVLFSNRPAAVSKPRLHDLTATILDYYGVPAPEGTLGRPLF